MSKTATRKGVAAGQADRTSEQTGRQRHDWEAIERAFRAGVLSIREIAKQHGLTDAGIRKKAKEFGWVRDLTEKVQAKVRAELVRTEVRRQVRTPNARTEREIVDEHASTIVEVVKLHRRDARDGRELVYDLLGQLRTVAGNREAIEEAIHAETPEADDPKAKPLDRQYARVQRAAMLKAVSLPSHAATARDLANAMGKLVSIEREAYSIDTPPPPKPPGEELSDAALDAFGAKLESVIGAAAADAAA